MSEEEFEGEVNGESCNFVLDETLIKIGNTVIAYSDINTLEEIPDRGTEDYESVYYVEFNDDRDSQEWSLKDPEGGFQKSLLEYMKKSKNDSDSSDSSDEENEGESREDALLEEQEKLKEKCGNLENEKSELENEVTKMKIQISQLFQDKQQIENRSTSLQRQLDLSREEIKKLEEGRHQKPTEEPSSSTEDFPEESGLRKEVSQTELSKTIESLTKKLNTVRQQNKVLQASLSQKEAQLQLQASQHKQEMMNYREQLEKEKQALVQQTKVEILKSSKDPKSNRLGQQLKFYKNKLAKQNEDLLMLRQQMMENDLFRERSHQKTKEVQSTFDSYETKLQDLECKYRLQKQRCEKMVRAQGNFIRKFRDETLKSITSERDVYWQSRMQQTERDLRQTQKKFRELTTEFKSNTKISKTKESRLLKNLKLEKNENQRLSKECKKYYDNFMALSEKNKGLLEMKKMLTKDNRQLRLNLDRQNKMIDRDKSMVFYYNKIYGEEQENIPSVVPQMKKKKKRKKSRRVKSRKSVSRKSSASLSKVRVLKEGKITMKNLEDMQQGDSPEKIGKVMDELDEIQEDRLNVEMFDTEKNKIKVESILETEN